MVRAAFFLRSASGLSRRLRRAKRRAFLPKEPNYSCPLQHHEYRMPNVDRSILDRCVSMHAIAERDSNLDRDREACC